MFQISFVSLCNQNIILMSKRVSQLLRQLNIGLDSLNRELAHMRQAQVEINTKLSDSDYLFLLDYFKSDEMVALDNAYKEVAKCRKELDAFFLHEFKPIDQLGEIERLLYYNWIIGFGRKFVSFQRLFPANSSKEFSVEEFEKLYRWYESWKLKTESERQTDEDLAVESIVNTEQPSIPIKRLPDGETAIMSSLKHGFGDVYGFE